MNRPELFVQSRNAMGTVFAIYLYAGDGEHAQASFEVAFAEIERLEEALSNYRPSSELSRINRLAGRQAVTTDPEVFGLLETALAYGQRSDGAFDVTVGPLMRAWRFFRGDGRYPTKEELRSALANVGWEKVQLDATKRTVRFAAPGVELDLGAIGKGYAVDRVVEVLREAGVVAALVDAGSSTLYALDAPPGKGGWTVRVQRPGDHSQTVSTVTLRNESLSTSGSDQKFFQLDGRSYCHIMDPREGTPVHGVLQTTLIASDGTTTDALSNAMFVMGPETCRKLLATVPHSRGLWILGELQVENPPQRRGGTEKIGPSDHRVIGPSEQPQISRSPAGVLGLPGFGGLGWSSDHLITQSPDSSVFPCLGGRCSPVESERLVQWHWQDCVTDGGGQTLAPSIHKGKVQQAI